MCSHDVDAAATLAACQSPQPTVLLPGHTTASLPSYPTGPCVLHKADIGSKQACTNLVAEAVNRYGRVDILVHNAAIQFPESPYDGSVSAHMQGETSSTDTQQRLRASFILQVDTVTTGIPDFHLPVHACMYLQTCSR